MRKRSILLITLSFALKSAVFAQETYLPDKQGEWHLTNRITADNCQYITDKTAFSGRMSSVADWIHRNNQIMIQLKGFNAQVNLNGLCNEVENSPAYSGFGDQGSIYIKFQLFSINDGKERVWTDYCPNTGIHINDFIYKIATRFDESGSKTDDPPELKQPLDKALENLRQYWMAAPAEKEFAPGVRLYAGNHLLIFNPDQPEFWQPVTVKEIMEAKLAYYKIKQEIDIIQWNKSLSEWAKIGFKPDEANKPCSYNIIKKEFDAFTPEELNKWAYSSNEDGVSMINAEGRGSPVMKFNPECWDRRLPKSAVQFIYMEFAQPSEEELNDFYSKNKRPDYVGLFIKAMPVEKMESLIDKISKD
jgi:hypothetical protein